MHNNRKRVGSYPCILQEGTKAFAAYQEKEITERHRHCHEVNNAYRDILAQHSLIFSGLSPDGQLVEIVEVPDHPWFVACVFHPEFKSRPNRAHPLFKDFVGAALKKAKR